MGQVHSSTWRQPKSDATPSEATTEWTDALAQQTFSSPCTISTSSRSPPTSQCHQHHEDFGTNMAKNEMAKKGCPRTTENGASPQQHLEATQVRRHTQRQPLSGPTPWHSRRSHHHVQSPLLHDHPRQANFTFTIEDFGTGRPRTR